MHARNIGRNIKSKQYSVSDVKLLLSGENSELNLLMDIPHLFIQNKKVNDSMKRFTIYMHAAKGKMYTVKSQDSVIGTNSSELRDKIMKQIPDDLRKTKQIVSNLYLAEGERTELAKCKNGRWYDK